MSHTSRSARSLIVSGVIAALCFAAPVTVTAKKNTQCSAAKAKLKRDKARGAPPGIIRADQARVRRACG